MKEYDCEALEYPVVAVTLKLLDVPTVGIPVNRPLAFNVRPAGRSVDEYDWMTRPLVVETITNRKGVIALF